MRPSGRAVRTFLPFMLISAILIAPLAFDIIALKDISPVGSAAAAQTPIAPIVIEGNSGLASHPSVRGGAGTAVNPYIISDYIIDCRTLGRGGIAIRNTTLHYTVRNVTIYASNSVPAIALLSLYSGGSYRAMNGRFINISVIGGNVQINLNRPIEVVFADSSFTTTTGSGNLIYTYSGYYLYFHNNTFSASTKDIYFEGTQYTFVTRNSGSIYGLRQSSFRYSNVANNTFTTTRWQFYSGYSSDIQGNTLRGASASYDLISLIDCNRIKVANNTLQGGKDSLYVSHPNSYSPIYNYYWAAGNIIIEFNRFNASAMGIEFYWTTNHAYVTYMSVHHNRFTNCTGYAVSLQSGGSPTSRVWHNLFEFNKGSTTTYSSAAKQARDTWAQFAWYRGGTGNYWRDKTVPDEDSNGIVDDGFYSLESSSNARDHAPVTNPYFDFERPYLTIMTPESRFPPNSYVNFTWSAKDNLSGVKTVEIRNGFNPWIDVSERDHHAFYLAQGQYRIYMRVTDRADLFVEVETDIFIESTIDPFTIVSPANGGYYGSLTVHAFWIAVPYFVPWNLTTTLDGESPVERSASTAFDMVLSQGPHIMEFDFLDHYGTHIFETVSFTVDITYPEVEILYPAPGSVISNGLVKFRWVSTDNIGIARDMVSINGTAPVQKVGRSFSQLLPFGRHTLKVTTYDLAGNPAEAKMDFLISTNTSLHIKAPLLTEPTSKDRHLVEWEYLSDFEVDKLSVRFDNAEPVFIPQQLTSYEVQVTMEGDHRIEIMAEDPEGNIISDSIGLTYDKTPPVPGFISPEEDSFINSTSVSLLWNAVDSFGIASYDLLVDDFKVASGLSEAERSVTLEPGKHKISVVAYDRAGNYGEDSIFLIVDTLAPTLKILSPAEGVLTEPYQTFYWEGKDDWGIAYYNYTLDGKTTLEMADGTSKQVLLTEGAHTFVLRCVDLAGNIRTVRRDLTVDLTPPELQFIGAPSAAVKTWSGVVRWSVTESVGLTAVRITVDGVAADLAVSANYHFVDLDEGVHTISVIVTDMGGWTDEATVTFAIDNTAPLIKKDTPDIVISGGSATIQWTLTEDPFNLTRRLWIDGSLVESSFSLRDGSYEFKGIPEGPHNATLNVTDMAGNSVVLRWDFTIGRADIGDHGQGSGTTVIFLAIGTIIILVILIVLVAVIMRKGKEKGAPRKEAPRMAAKPDRIKIGPMIRVAPVAAAATPQAHHKAFGHEPAYIRPEKPKEKKRTIIDSPATESSTTVQNAPETVKAGPHEPIEYSMPEETVEDWSGDEIDTWDEMEEVEEWEEMEEI